MSKLYFSLVFAIAMGSLIGCKRRPSSALKEDLRQVDYEERNRRRLADPNERDVLERLARPFRDGQTHFYNQVRRNIEFEKYQESFGEKAIDHKGFLEDLPGIYNGEFDGERFPLIAEEPDKRLQIDAKLYEYSLHATFVIIEPINLAGNKTNREEPHSPDDDHAPNTKEDSEEKGEPQFTHVRVMPLHQYLAQEKRKEKNGQAIAPSRYPSSEIGWRFDGECAPEVTRTILILATEPVIEDEIDHFFTGPLKSNGSFPYAGTISGFEPLYVLGQNNRSAYTSGHVPTGYEQKPKSYNAPAGFGLNGTKTTPYPIGSLIAPSTNSRKTKDHLATVRREISVTKLMLNPYPDITQTGHWRVNHRPIVYAPCTTTQTCAMAADIQRLIAEGKKDIRISKFRWEPNHRPYVTDRFRTDLSRLDVHNSPEICP